MAFNGFLVQNLLSDLLCLLSPWLSFLMRKSWNDKTGCARELSDTTDLFCILNLFLRMIKAHHHGYSQRFLTIHSIWSCRTDFRASRSWKGHADDEQSALLIGTTSVCRYGFLGVLPQQCFLTKRVCIMMLEEQLRSRMFLSRLGAFSINPRSRSVVESLDYASERLSTPGNLVVVYPQGRIASATSDLPAFESGIDRVLRRSNNFKVLFYAAFTDYFSHRKPGLYFYLEEVGESIVNADDLRNKYASFYEASRMEQSKKATWLS